MTDLHIHTRFSHDSGESAENYIKTAQNLGITCLGFSEHYDYDVYLEGEGQKAPLPDLTAYGEALRTLSEKHAQIKILKGIELGYSKAAEPHYKSLLASGNFDYCILSVHTVIGRGDCFYPEFFKGLTKKFAYEQYFKAVLESVRSGIGYQIIGHLGYVARYAPYAEKKIIYAEFSDILDVILKEIISRGKCLEINTSARGTNECTVPGAEIIERYASLGGKNFSLGSDAHSAERLAENFSAVGKLLLSLGADYVCRFEGGKLIKEKI